VIPLDLGFKLVEVKGPEIRMPAARAFSMFGTRGRDQVMWIRYSLRVDVI
jgi:hypothetical protein